MPQPKNTATQLESEHEPVLDPMMEHVVFACVLEHPAAFHTNLHELRSVFRDEAVRTAFQAYLKVLGGAETVTMAATFQQAFEDANYGNPSRVQKLREELNKLQAVVSRIDADGELPFIRQHIGRWLAQWRHDTALSSYLQALEDYRSEPSEEHRSGLERAKHDLNLALIGGRVGLTIVDAATLATEELPEAINVIEGVLDQGDVLMFGGASKTRKTWVSLSAALSVAAGLQFWKFNTAKGRVLYLNFEISPKRFQERLKAVSEAEQIVITEGMLDVMHLKGVLVKPEELIQLLIQHCRLKDYSLVIIDPLYSLLAGKVENSAEEMAELMVMIGTLARVGGCAVWFTHHFSKGNQAAKSAIDRVSGSGVFGRFPDAIVTMTAHKVEDNYTVEFELRNHKDVEAFVVEWVYPSLKINSELDPQDLKQPRRGNSQKAADSELLAGLGATWTSTSKWCNALKQEGVEISLRNLQRRAKELLKKKRIEAQEQGRSTNWRNPHEEDEK